MCAGIGQIDPRKVGTGAKQLGILRPAYRQAELTKALNLPWSPARLLRVLKRGGVEPQYGLILINQIHDRMPDFWASLLLFAGVIDAMTTRDASDAEGEEAQAIRDGEGSDKWE